jgi:hypothetical protein
MSRSPTLKSRNRKTWYTLFAASGIALVAVFAILNSRANAERQTFINQTSQALLRLQKENRPAVFSSNVVVPLDPVAGQAARFDLPAELRDRNPFVCVVTSNRVDLRCVLAHYMLQKNVSDRWVLERDANDFKKWSLFEMHGFWGRRGPFATIAE